MASNNVPRVKFWNGYEMPMFGLGTYLSNPGEVERAVKYAIEVGYRYIDNAYLYKNEREVGDAVKAKIADGTVKREDLFISSKLWNNAHAKDSVVPMCKKSLENLGLEYMDLYLIHWPFGFKEGEDLNPVDENGRYIYSDVDYLETWRGMEECVRLGLTRSIGLSNFNSQQILRILEIATIRPALNQIEVNINYNQQPFIDFCKKHQIVCTGYSPLGRPGNRRGIPTGLDNSTIAAIAKKYKKTPAQIACRYVLQQGAAPIPKSVNESRIKENFDIFDFKLSDDDMEAIKAAGTQKRMCPFDEVEDHKYYPFAIPY